LRIVSLLPSATEFVCALGLEKNLVGVTHECDYPPTVKQLPKVTRTLIPIDVSSQEIDRLVREHLKSQRALYTLNLPLLESLRPDLIVTQALCDVCAVAEEEVRDAACRLPGNPRVINLEPQSLRDVFDSLRQIAEIVGLEDKAHQVIQSLTDRVDVVVDRAVQLQRSPRVAFLEWLDPPFSSGHWNPELVQLAGGIEGLGRAGHPSRTLDWEQVFAWRPDIVFIACCGFDVERTMQDISKLWSVPGWLHVPAVQSGQVYVTDGSQYFNRPGPRLVDSLEILAHAISPTVHPIPKGLQPAIRVPNPEYVLR
jgi:iron complex transport system substrate-binding protein